MPQKRAHSNNKGVQHRDRHCCSPRGQLKVTHRILLVKKYEETRYFSAVAREFDCHEDTVKRWVSRYQETGDVERSPYQDRQSPTMTPELITRALHLIDDAVKVQTYGIPSWAKLVFLLRAEGFTFSRRSLTRTLRKEGIMCRTVRRTPSLTPEHKRKRVEFCKELEKWTPRELENILWTDEKKFTCGGSKNATYLCRRTDPVKEHAGEREK